MNIPFLIAEIGINHNGSLLLAKELISQANLAGFDAVKFQKRTIDKVYTQEFLSQTRDSPFGSTQREQKEGLEFNEKEYTEIDTFCKGLGIHWLASAWDIDSQKFLSKFELIYNKIASPMLFNNEFLDFVASEKKHTFVSTGMSTIEEIDKVVEIFQKQECPFELMHAVSEYPLAQSNANLLCIKTLRERYGCNVGYSGHETCLLKVSLLAASLGATSIERHITLDRAMYGSDQSASIETRALKDFVDAIRLVPDILGNGEKKLTDIEKKVKSKLVN